MTPKEILRQWVAAFNAADAGKLASFYHEEAVNYQVPVGEVKGKSAIRARFEEEFAGPEMVCLVENLFEDGEWAILEWRDPLGLCGCGFFRIVDGLIVYQRGYWDRLSFLRQHNLPVE